MLLYNNKTIITNEKNEPLSITNQNYNFSQYRQYSEQILDNENYFYGFQFPSKTRQKK